MCPRYSLILDGRSAIHPALWALAREALGLARHAIIIGAGVVGMTSAYALARRGWRVIVVDSESGPAMGTSHANGAQLSYCFTDALGSPSTFKALPRLLRGKGGVSLRLSAQPAYWRWLAGFARNCTDARFRANTLAVLELAAQSRAAMERLCERHTLEFAHRAAGKVNLIYSAAERARAVDIIALKRAFGGAQDLIDRRGLEWLDPALENLDPDVIGAISTPSEMVGDPLLFCRSLQRVLVEDYSVEFRFGAQATDLVETGEGAVVTLSTGEQIRADLAIVAAGNASNALLAPLGQAVNLAPIKGYSFEMPVSDSSPSISVTDYKRRLVFTNLGDRMRIAGIAEVGNGSRAVDRSRIEWLINAARDCMPGGGDYSQARKFWAGLRPTTPHSQPVIRRAGASLAINTGHGSLGWTLAMGSAERLAQLVEG